MPTNHKPNTEPCPYCRRDLDPRGRQIHLNWHIKQGHKIGQNNPRTTLEARQQRNDPIARSWMVRNQTMAIPPATDDPIKADPIAHYELAKEQINCSLDRLRCKQKDLVEELSKVETILKQHEQSA